MSTDNYSELQTKIRYLYTSEKINIDFSTKAIIENFLKLDEDKLNKYSVTNFTSELNININGLSLFKAVQKKAALQILELA